MCGFCNNLKQVFSHCEALRSIKQPNLKQFPAIIPNLLRENLFLLAQKGTSMVVLFDPQKIGFLSKGFSLLSGLKTSNMTVHYLRKKVNITQNSKRMNNKIVKNLFEFWSYIGIQNNSFNNNKKFKTVSILGADWPKRVYDVVDSIESYEEISKSNIIDSFPKIVTIHKPTKFLDLNKFQLSFTHINMGLDLKNNKNESFQNKNIYQIKTKSDVAEFAKVASQAFNYHVDGAVVYNVAKNSQQAKLYVFRENLINYGCGIIFFDSNNVAGFHMIGTISEGRGRGIGKSITERLIHEAVKNNSKYCVLNASKMGESIYKKLGFTAFGILENYKIV